MSLYGALTSAISGLNAFQLGTQVVSENLANADNVNYRARRESYTDIGLPNAGVVISQIERRTDELLQRRVWDASALNEAESVRDRLYTRLEELTGGSSSRTYLATSVNELVRSMIELEAAPETDASQVVVLNKARDLEYEFERLGAGLAELRAAIGVEVGSTADAINRSIREIAQLNRQILGLNRRNGDFSQVENLLEKRIDEVAKSINLRVFRSEEGFYRVYSRDGSILIADTQVGLQLEWDENSDQVINTVSGFDITSSLPDGRLRAQIDFLAREDRVTPGGRTINVIDNDNVRLGVLSKYERHLDELARLLTNDGSGTQQGQPTGFLRDLATGDFGTGVPSNPANALSNSFGSNVYPDQIYIDDTLSAGGVGQEFFASRTLLRSIYDKLEASLADVAFNAPTVQIDLTPQEQALFTSYQGTAAPANTPRLNFSLDKAAPTDPDGTTARADAATAFGAIGDLLLNRVAIPDNVLHVKEQTAFTLQNGVVVQPPPKPAAPSVENPLTLADLRSMIDQVDTYLTDYPDVAGSQSLRDVYNNWNVYQQHEFRQLVNVIQPDVLVAVPFPPANEALNLSHNQVTEIRRRLAQIEQPPVNPPAGSALTSLEHYWSDKLFVPSDPSRMGLSRVDRFTFSVNPDAAELLRDLHVDTQRITNVVNSLLTPQRSLNAAGLVISNQDYDGVARQLSVDFSRRAEQISGAAERTKSVSDALVERFQNRTGVNIDEEMSRLVLLQNNYSAAARMITTITRMFDALEQAIR